MQLSVTFLCVLLQAVFVSADTEIINFDALFTPELILPMVSEWPALSPEEPRRNFNVLPAPFGARLEGICESPETATCPHEQWVILDLDSAEWLSFSKFTLRVSWPANHPAQFKLNTYTPGEIHRHHAKTQPASSQNVTSSSSTRRQYARIRLVDTGVRTPPVKDVSIQAVPFTLLLEPLYFSALPASVVPIVSFIVAVVVVASFVVAPAVNRKLAAVALHAREETAGSTAKKTS